MAKEYLIRFCPVEDFFFGGEVTYGDGENQNYLVKSNPFPQQTTVLGTLRKELLIQKGFLKPSKNGYTLDQGKKKEIEELIGPESFDMSKPARSAQNFGTLKRISPVFLYQGNGPATFLSVAPLDSKLQFTTDVSGSTMLNGDKKAFTPCLKGYDPKATGLFEGFTDTSGNLCASDSVFAPVESIGINKGEKGVTEEKGFFKRTAYRLKKGFQFACIVELESDLKDALVCMGGDKSAFLMRVEAFGQSFKEIFGRNNDSTRIVLLSDAHVEREIYSLCRFAVTRTLSFRNIKSATGNYAFRKEAKLHTFLERGSVIYTDTAGRTALTQMLDNIHMQSIGYNIYA